MRSVIALQPGNRYGSLVTLKPSGINKYGHSTWLCQCDCGVQKDLGASKLKSHQVRSCGCRRYERKHGHTGTKFATPTYVSWAKMVARCRPGNCNEARYSQRGISVCERWLKFENFLADMGERPSSDHSIDRYPDNDGNYNPENCRWATRSEQARNTSITRNVIARGKKQCLSAWAEETGIPISTIRRRLAIGWGAEEALSTPPRKQCRARQEN